MNRKERRAAAKRSHGAGAAPPSADAAGLFAEALRQHQLGRMFDAEALCRAVLSREARHAGALHLLGVIAMQRGLFEEAAGHFGKAAEIRPDIAIGHHSLGNALAAAGRPDAAAVAIERALALAPDFAEAHKDLGLALMAQGRFKEASKSFARALQLVPELAENAADTVATLLAVNPALRDGVARAAAAWPDHLTIDQMLGAPGLAALADDAMLLAVLKGTTVRDVALERFLTSIRAAVLKQAAAAARRRAGVSLRAGAAMLQQRIRLCRKSRRDRSRRAAAGLADRGAGPGRGHRAGSVLSRWQAIVRCRRCRTRGGFSTALGQPRWTNC